MSDDTLILRMQISRVTLIWMLCFSVIGCATLEQSLKEAARINADQENARQLAYGGGADNPIVGGSEVAADDSDARSTILILITRGSVLHACTSVLVAPKVLLTAAHCVSKVEPSKVRIVFHKRGGQGLVKDLYPSRILLHQKYDGTPESKADVALLALPEKPPAGYSPIQLLSASEKVTSDEVLLLGYGITGESKKDSLTLRKTKKSWAKEIHPKDGFFGITQSTPSGGFCRGDSGAPVVVSVQNGQQRLAGINSFTVGVEKDRECHTASVAMSVPHFKSWIESHAKKL